MVKLSRYILVFIGIMAAAIAIPQLYWTIFREAASTPNIVYSRVLDDFMMIKRQDGLLVRMDAQGNVYSRSDFEEKLPLLFFRQLYATGEMPDTIDGVPMNHSELSLHSSNFTFRPVDMNTPRPVLWPLLESRSGRVGLELPEDYFRLKDRIEFIVAETNSVKKGKSRVFNDALIAEGFEFPARLIGGLPTARKNEEEGYFVKDNSGDIFHLMMVRGEPFVKRIDIPEHKNIVHIECVDLATREYYAFLFTDDNDIYLLMQDEYRLQRLPIKGYDREIHRLRVREDLLHKTITITGDDHTRVTVADSNYKVIDIYDDQWESSYQRRDHVIFSALFPFQVNVLTPDSRYVGLNFFWPKGYAWLLTNLVFAGLAIWQLKRKDRRMRSNITDLLIIIITGIFGYISTRVFPNKFYD